MRRKIEELKASLQEFVDQSDSLVLVVNATDSEILYVIKALEAVEQESTSDLFLTFPRPLKSKEGYLQDVAASLEAQVAGAQKMQEAEKLPLWPSLPSECKDPALGAGERLRAVFDFVRGLLPREEDHRAVVGFLPVAIEAPADYAGIVGAMLPWDGFQPWMRRLRLVIRDSRERPFLIPYLQRERTPGVLVLDVDLSAEAMNDALASAAADASLPKEERMQALLQLAALDLGHQRYLEAVKKYGVLFQHYEEAKQPHLQAMCLQGVGDVLRRLRKLPEAKERYQQGLAMAVPAGSLPVMLNLLLAAGEVCLELRQFQEAEGYLSLASEVAGKVLNIYIKCDAMEEIGVARLAQRKYREAVEVWRNATELCKQADYLPRWQSVLRRLMRLYQEGRMDRERDECQEQLRRVQALIRERRAA